MFGNTQVFSSTTTVADRRAMPYTMPEKGNIQSICIYHEGGTGNLLLAVYNDNGSGKPGTRLGVTESTSINGSAGWQTVELTSPVDVEEGQTIWLAWVFSNNPGIRYTTGSPGRAASGVGWSGGMPGSFGSSTTSSYIYSIYANYTSTGLIGNPYMFTGRRFDIETGLYYYRARYYNPHIGRFMQTDPVGYGDGMNWYLYCGNNPLAFVDPSGLDSIFKATSNIMILPWRLDPGEGIPSAIVSETAGVVINLLDYSKIPDIDIRAKIIKKYLKALKDITGSLTKVAGQDTNGYRVFIETVEYSDSNGDGEPDVDENGEWITLNDAAWNEVRGIRYPMNQNYQGWFEGPEGGGYRRWEDALSAGIVGIVRYPTDIPESYIDPLFIGDTYGPGINASNKFLESLKNFNKIMEDLINIKDDIDIIDD